MKVEMITGQKDFKRLRPVWNRLVDESETPSVFLTHEWYSAWWANLSAGRQLYIILIKEENGTLTGIAPCCRAEGRLQFMADKDVTDYCDIIVKKGHSAACLDALFSCFRQEIVQDMEVFFVNIPDSSPTVSFLPGAAAQNGFIYRKSQIESAPWLYLPDSVSDYLQSLDRKARHEVKRKTRRIEKESSLRLEYITEPGRIEQVMPDFIRLHENCGADKRSFWMKTGMKAFFRTMAFGLSSRNMAEMNLLYLNDTLIGALFNFIYAEKKIYFYNAAYHPEYAQYSPGIYLFYSRIKSAIETGFLMADFLRGREKYKYSFGAHDRALYQWIFHIKENQA